MTFIRAEFVLEDPTTPGRGWLYRIICRADSLQKGRRRGLERLCEALGADLQGLVLLCGFALHVPGVSREKPITSRMVAID